MIIDMVLYLTPCKRYAEKKNIPKKVKRMSKNNNQSQKTSGYNFVKNI